MSRVFITGSADGLGLMAARLLAGQRHQVTLHARNATRAADTRAALPQAAAVVAGDVSDIAGMRSVADEVNALGRQDAVIHNAGVGYREPRISTADGLSQVFAVNVLAAYLLTALITPPGRRVQGTHPDARSAAWQDALLDYCARLTGVALPARPQSG